MMKAALITVILMFGFFIAVCFLIKPVNPQKAKSIEEAYWAGYYEGEKVIFNGNKDEYYREGLSDCMKEMSTPKKEKK